jgi:hypothetical protein
VQGEFGGLEGVQNLRCGITSEVTDAGGFVVHCSGQFLCRDRGWEGGLLFVLIVLTVETIEGAGVIKDGQVFVTIFRTL